MPAEIVTGNEIPLTANGPLTFADETVTLAPLAVMVPVPVWLLPTATLPKLTDDGVTVSCPCWVVVMPVPLTASSVGEFEASLEKEIFSEAVPEPSGENVSTKFALLPAAMVIGNEMPVTENGGATDGGDERVTLAPLALRVPV